MNAPAGPSRWRKAGWFVLLWVGGVVAAIVLAAVFKVLMLGAVKQ